MSARPHDLPGDDSTAHERWLEVLGDYAAALAAMRRDLAVIASDPTAVPPERPPFVPPPGLPPPPQSLLPRLTALARETDEVVALGTALRARLQPAAARRVPAGAPVADRLDRSI